MVVGERTRQKGLQQGEGLEAKAGERQAGAEGRREYVSKVR